VIRSRRVTGLALIAVLATVAGVMAATAVAGVKRQHADFNLKMGYVTGRAHPYGLSMEQYKRLVETASNGRVAITLTPVYAGGDDIVLMNDVNKGTQDGAAISIAVLPNGNINNLIPLQLPFLVDSYELEGRLITNSSGIARTMLRGIERNSNLTPVGLFEGGMRHFVLKDKYVDSLDDLKGVSMRTVQAPHMSDTFKRLGANPNPLPVSDVAASLRSGLVTGAEANSGLIRVFGWNTAGANRVSVVNIFPFPAVVVFRKEVFAALPADIQTILRDSANDLAAFSLTTGAAGNTTTFPGLLCAAAGGAAVRYQVVPPAVRNQMAALTKTVIKKYTTGRYRNLAPVVAAINRQKARIKNPKPVDTPPASCIDGAQNARFLTAAP